MSSRIISGLKDARDALREMRLEKEPELGVEGHVRQSR